MGLLHLLYEAAAFIIWDCCIYYMRLLHLYISGTYIQMYVLHLLYAHAAFTYGAPAFIYVFIYDVRAICINFDTNGTP